MPAKKPLTQTQLIEKLAESQELTRKQVKAFFGELNAIAYKEAKAGFSMPGLGKLVLVKRKARKGRNPATGETIKIPAKTVVKFKVSKIAKDAITGVKVKEVPAKKTPVKKAAVKKAVKKGSRKK